MNLYSKLKDMEGWPQEKDAVLNREEDWGNEMWDRACQEFKSFLLKVEVDDLEIMTIMKNEVLRIAKTGKHFKWKDLAQAIAKGLKYKEVK